MKRSSFSAGSLEGPKLSCRINVGLRLPIQCRQLLPQVTEGSSYWDVDRRARVIASCLCRKRGLSARVMVSI